MSASPSSSPAPQMFQQRVEAWLLACFGVAIARDVRERNHRFIEEALEVVQSTGCTASEAHQLVEYVYSRPTGEPAQEVGGVMVTLAALCSAVGLDLTEASERELARVWTKVEQIRAKQAAKPKHSPLPAALAVAGSAPAPPDVDRPPCVPFDKVLQSGDARYLRGIVRAHRLHGGPKNQPVNVDALERVLWRAGLYSGAIEITEAACSRPPTGSPPQRLEDKDVPTRVDGERLSDRQDLPQRATGDK